MACEICVEIDYKHTYKLRMIIFSLLIIKMWWLQNSMVILDRFNMVAISSNENCAQKWITLLYSY
jgi:hypothetical protein